MKDILSATGISVLLPSQLRGLRIFAYDSIDSTSTEARRLIAAGEIGDAALVTANSQTAGRGRQGRSFFSPADTGLYMTLAIRTAADFADAVSLTTMASVAAVRAIKRLTPLEPQIKWVNDIYIGGKKVCGILTEAVGAFGSGEVYILIGVGVNISTADFPSEIENVAASLGQPLSRNALAAELTAELMSFAENLADKSYIDEYRAHSLVIGRDITYTRAGEITAARAVGIDENGGLEVEHADGSRDTLRSGEISVRLAPNMST